MGNESSSVSTAVSTSVVKTSTKDNVDLTIVETKHDNTTTTTENRKDDTRFYTKR